LILNAACTKNSIIPANDPAKSNMEVTTLITLNFNPEPVPPENQGNKPMISISVQTWFEIPTSNDQFLVEFISPFR